MIEASSKHYDLLKFRALSDDVATERAICSITTGRFWASRFFDLNDAMEGVYSFTDPRMTAGVFDAKKRQIVCSFSGLKAQTDQLMWGYYANGLKGIAIHVQMGRNSKCLRQIRYCETPPNANDQESTPEDFLHWKTPSWAHEHEWRYSSKNPKPQLKQIGRVASLIVGDPYSSLTNVDQIEQEQSIARYLDRRDRVQRAAIDSGVAVYRAIITACGIDILPGATI